MRSPGPNVARYTQFLTNIDSLILTLFNNQPMYIRQLTTTFYPVYLPPNPESIPRRQCRTI